MEFYWRKTLNPWSIVSFKYILKQSFKSLFNFHICKSVCKTFILNILFINRCFLCVLYIYYIDKGISLGTKTFVQHRATCSPRFPRVPLTSLYTTRGIAVLFQPGHLHREPRKILGTWYIWWNIWNKMWQKVRTWEISGVCMVLQTCLLL